MERIKHIITSKYFLPAVFVVFGLQAVFFAAAINNGTAPDEGYHFRSIQNYASQPVQTSPLNIEQDPDSIADLRVVERVPDYLYHYSLSFLARFMNAIDLSEDAQIFILRLFSVALALAALFVFKKILDELSDNNLLKNLSVAALSLTGMFVWLAAAINYDNLANLLFFVAVLFVVRTIKNPGIFNAAWSVIFGLLTVFAKFTFLPITAISFLVVAYCLAGRYKSNLAGFRSDLKKEFASRRALSVIGLVLIISLSLLFIERVGGNLINLQQVNPTCQKIFTQEQCFESKLIKRGPEAREVFVAQGGVASLDFDPFTHTAEWVYEMYNGLYFYLGHQRFGSNKYSELSIVILLLVFAVTLFLSRRKINMKKEMWFVLGVTLIYLLMVYLFNTKTLLSVGQEFAWQGRYLLPVMGFVYFFGGLIVLRSIENLRGIIRTVFTYVWIAVLAMAIASHFPSALFYKYTGQSWTDDSFFYTEIKD